jgi:hypothetical protein
MVAGYEKDYLVNMGDGRGVKTVIFSNLNIPYELVLEVESAINDNKKNMKYSSFEMDQHTISFTLRESVLPVSEKALLNLITYCSNLLHEKGIESSKKCTTCGSEKTDLYYYNHTDLHLPLCSSCYTKESYTIEKEKREYNSEDKNYGRGFLGSIIFNIPGLILWMGIAVLLESIAGIMAFVLFYLGKKGYEKFGGKEGKVKPFIILGVSIAFVLISNIATIVFLLVKNGVPVDDTFYLLMHN